MTTKEHQSDDGPTTTAQQLKRQRTFCRGHASRALCCACGTLREISPRSWARQVVDESHEDHWRWANLLKCATCSGMTVHAALIDPGHKWRDLDDGPYVDSLSMFVATLNQAVELGAQIRFETATEERPLATVTLHQTMLGDRQDFLVVVDRDHPVRSARDALEVVLAFMQAPDVFVSCSEEQWSEWDDEKGEAWRWVDVWGSYREDDSRVVAGAAEFLMG